MIGLTTAALGFGSNPQPRPTSFSLCEPNPEYLVWDTKQQEDGLVLLETGVPLPQTTEPATYFGWLKVPILHDQPGLEELGVPLGYTALRVSVMTRCSPAAKPLLVRSAHSQPLASIACSQANAVCVVPLRRARLGQYLLSDEPLR